MGWAVGPAVVEPGVVPGSGGAGRAGREWNLINLVALPLLIGIDVDYGIYLVSLARGPAALARRRTRVERSFGDGVGRGERASGSRRWW